MYEVNFVLKINLMLKIIYVYAKQCYFNDSIMYIMRKKIGSSIDLHKMYVWETGECITK